MKRLLATLTFLLLLQASTHATITYVGGQSGNFAGTTTTQTITFSLTGGAAATPAAGDLVFITLCTGSTVDRAFDIETTGSINYTSVELYGDDTVDTNMTVGYRIMPASPETQFQFNGGSGNAADGAAWTVHVFRNVSVTRMNDVTGTFAAAGNTHLANPPSITPVTAGTVVLVTACGATATGANYASAGLTDFRTNTAVDTNDADVGSGYVAWTSGAVDIAAFTGGGGDSVNDSWISLVFALRDAATMILRDVIGGGVIPAKR